MNEEEKQRITNRYRERLQKLGPGIDALASGTTERRATRFGILSSLGNMQGASVLDIGCGLADFYAYILENGIEANYTGYDITEDFIQIAQERFPNGHFEVRDIQTQGIPTRFDYIVSSQTFNNRFMHDDNMQVMQDVLRIAYEACDKGLAVDMMTSYVDFKEDHLFYYQPEDIFRYAKSLTKRVMLRHDYPTFEFAIFLFKDFTGWRK